MSDDIVVDDHSLDLLDWLRQKHQEMPNPEAESYYSIAVGEIMWLMADNAQWKKTYDALVARAGVERQQVIDAHVADSERLNGEIEGLRILLAEAIADADSAAADADRAEAEADRWKADAGRLAALVEDTDCFCMADQAPGTLCWRCRLLDLHDKEVEAR